MKNKTKTSNVEIISIIDMSGSMSSYGNEAIGTYNAFIDSQKKLKGNANVSLFLFDNQYETLYESTPIADVVDLTEETYKPRGSTALYDAIGKTISSFEEKHKTNKPDKTIIIILTDGEENSSNVFSSAKVKEMIDTKIKENWEFVYLCSDVKQYSDTTFDNIKNTLQFATQDANGVAGFSGFAGRGFSGTSGFSGYAGKGGVSTYLADVTTSLRADA